MKFIRFITILLILSSCEDVKKPLPTRAQNIYAKAVGEGVAYGVLQQDSFIVYTNRFVRIAVDSPENAALRYAQSFRYLVNKKKVPTDAQVKAEMRNPVIMGMKD